MIFEKIKEIIAKDKSLNGADIEVIFKDKKTEHELVKQGVTKYG